MCSNACVRRRYAPHQLFSDLIARINIEIQAKFVITGLGPATYFHGEEWNPLRNRFFMDQAANVRTILESRFMMN
jgi:hypothetical protein